MRRPPRAAADAGRAPPHAKAPAKAFKQTLPEPSASTRLVKCGVGRAAAETRGSVDRLHVLLPTVIGWLGAACGARRGWHERQFVPWSVHLKPMGSIGNVDWWVTTDGWRGGEL